MLTTMLDLKIHFPFVLTFPTVCTLVLCRPAEPEQSMSPLLVAEVNLRLDFVLSKSAVRLCTVLQLSLIHT